MAEILIAPEKYEAVLQDLQAGKSKSAIKRDRFIAHSTIIRIAEALQRGEVLTPRAPFARTTDPVTTPPVAAASPKPPEPPITRTEIPTAPEDGEIERKIDGDTYKVNFKTSKMIETAEDALEFAKIDTSIWRIKQIHIKDYQVTLKLREFTDGKVVNEKPLTVQMYAISLVLVRLIPENIHAAIHAVFEEMKVHSPIYVPQIRRPVRTPHLLVADFVDVHFGKYCWAAETGQPYTLELADEVFRNAMIDTLDMASGFDIAEIVLPIGSDALHVDNAANTTSAGTPQSTDGPLKRIYQTAKRAYIWAVEHLANVAPVKIYYVPGNHDTEMSYYLADTVATWFRNHRDVEVDISEKTRKYHAWERILIGMTHGNEEKHASLPTIMATEEPLLWANATCREWHTGHFHKAKQTSFVPVDTHDGMKIRVLQSLSATDYWHYKKGYVGNQRAAESLIYNPTAHVATMVANARVAV